MVSRVILQSGSVYAPWAIDPPGTARPKALRVAALAGCKRPSSEQMLECLQKVDPYTIVKFADNFRTWWDRDPLVLFKPVIEKPGPNGFITDLPSDWTPIKVPALMGLAEEDGLLRSAYMKQLNYDFPRMSKNLRAFLPPSLFYGNKYTIDVAGSTDKILKHYFGKKTNFTGADEFQFSELYSDALFRWPLYRAVENSLNKVYLYVNGFRNNYIYLIRNRVMHVQEVFFLWEPEVMPNSLTGEDLEFSKLIVGFWSQFVLNGNPNGRGTIPWAPTEKDSLNFYYIRNNGSSMAGDLYKKQVKFWNESSGVLNVLRTTRTEPTEPQNDDVPDGWGNWFMRNLFG